MLWCWAGLLRLVVILWPAETVQPPVAKAPVEALLWPTNYDPIFRKYSKRFFGPGWDWRWFKAQAIAESTLKPRARSRSGAVGLMQIKPSTFREIRKSNPEFLDLHSPHWNIAAGIYYDHFMFRHRTWEKLPERERLLLAFASYNSGLGGTLRAYKRARAPVKSWAHVAPHARAETRNYVARIVELKTGTGSKRAKRTPRQRGAAARHKAPAEKPPKKR